MWKNLEIPPAPTTLTGPGPGSGYRVKAPGGRFESDIHPAYQLEVKKSSACDRSPSQQQLNTVDRP